MTAFVPLVLRAYGFILAICSIIVLICHFSPNIVFLYVLVRSRTISLDHVLPCLVQFIYFWVSAKYNFSCQSNTDVVMSRCIPLHENYYQHIKWFQLMYMENIQKNMWPCSTKPVISRRGLFVAIVNNTLYWSKLMIFLSWQKSLWY